jgi:hypothetical protein
MPRITNIKIRRGTEQEWISIDPILSLGELGYETTNNVLKVGDGVKTWTELGVQSLYSPIRLDSDGNFLNNTSIRSPEIDFTISGSTEIFSVPENSMFFINSMEILTTKLYLKDETPSIKIGNQFNDSLYYQETFVSINDLGARHIIEDPKNGAEEGFTIIASVVSPSTAEIHKGYVIINGILFTLAPTPTLTPTLPPPTPTPTLPPPTPTPTPTPTPI